MCLHCLVLQFDLSFCDLDMLLWIELQIEPTYLSVIDPSVLATAGNQFQWERAESAEQIKHARSRF